MIELNFKRLSAVFVSVVIGMFSVGTSAQTPDVDVTFTSSTAANFFKTYGDVTVATSATLSAGSNSDGYCIKLDKTVDGVINQGYFEVVSAGAAISKIELDVTANSSNASIQPTLLGWKSSAAVSSATNTADYVTSVSYQGGSTYNVGSAASTVTFDLSGQDLKAVRVFRMVKNMYIDGSSSATSVGVGQTVRVWGFRVYLAASGPKAPVLSISDNATQSVSQGNAISNIVVTSDKAATFNLTGSLPTGVSGTATDSKTYTISGSSNVIGNYTYSVTATADGLTSDAVGGTISVVEGPALNITNGTQEVMVGNAITNIVVTSDNPSTTFGVTGLPAGVTGSGSGSTYTISGTPTAEGTFNFVVSGTAGGNTKTVNGTITVTEKQETSTNYTINTKLSAAPTTANGGIPAALSGATVKAYVGGSSWTSSGYKFGANKDTLTIDITNVDGAYITGASFPVTMGSTYTIAYSFDDVDNADDAVYESVSFGASGATATITCPSYAKKLRLRRNVGTGTTVGNILLTVATGVTLPPVLSISGNKTQSVSQGKAIESIVVTSDKPATFNAEGLPAGVSGNTSADGLTYTISGVPTQDGAFTYSVTGTADGKTSVAVGGTLTVVQGPVLNITNASQTTTNGTAIKTIQITSNDGETTYSVSGLPSGVTGSGSGTSFAISGTPTAVGTFQYVVTGTLGGYSKTVNGTIIVQPAAPKLTASSNVEQEVQLNHAISTITITSDTAVAFSISCLPAGVVAIAGADSTRLIITGKATMLETTSFSVVAKAHGKGKQSNSISGQITVTEDAVAAAPVLTPSASSISVDKGVAITDLVITSDVAAAWAIDKALPAGLTGTASADGLTYTISGTPTAVSASSVYTISATANELTAEQPITIAVNAVAPVVTAPSNATQNVALGEAIGNISFSSSDADAVFSVEGLPAGLTAVQNGSTYTISGTATAAGEFTYTVTATVDGLSDSKTGKITVNEPVTYSVTFKDYDGTVLKQQTGILAGGFATAPATPTRTGYTFAGWDKSYSNVTEDLIVTATYTINTYTVKFFDKDNNQIGATQTVNYGGNATAPAAPTVTGYTFAGWDKSYSNVTEDLVVTATYTINTYSVKFFDKDNNQIGATQTVNYGGNATAPAAPAVTGYTFAGWDKSYSNVTEDLIVTATYIINTYTVTFKNWNGDVLKTQSVAYGSAATAPATPTRTGYTFTGWDKSYSNVTEDLIVTATYTINTYTVIFKNWNGDVLKTQSVAYGSAATEPTVPARAGYTFTGWDADFSNVTGDIIATATFSTNAYSVTFNDWNGDVLKTQNVAYGNSATAPATPTRTGYTFAGWDKSYSNVTEDLVVTATYTINTYTVKFFDKDNNQIGATQTVNYGGNATAPTAPAVTGYTFAGWDKSYSNVTEDLIVTATYTINTYTVTFKNWNGDVLKTQSVAYGSAATEPTVPARTGYTFTGWDADFSNVTGDIIATATFSTNAYSVTFKDWNGDVLKSQNVAYGNSATAPVTPTRTGYTFSGWDKSYSNVTEDLVVTATYTINTYTVKFFDKDNNQIGTTQTVNYGGNATAPTAPAVTGYTFSGWDKSYSNVTEDLIVTATYTINTYTVTFKNWNGDVLKTQSVAYGSAATEPTVPARAGFTFTGWDADFSNVTGDIIATATFSTNAYSVTFKDWNGDVLKSQNVAYGNSATAPVTPTRTGYTFAGWDKSYSNVTEDLVVTATYTINTYTVTFKNWNGDVLSTQTVDYGAGATEPTVPAREGYEFIGWDKTFNNVMSDMIIIAQYEELSTPVAPSITVPDNATQTVALNENIEDITFEVDNTNADISVTGLPDGVTYEQLGNIVVISGKPTESGTFTYVVKAEADGLASTKESVIIVEEQPENPTSVDETALSYSWKQTQNSVALEGVNVKIMTLYSESGARIKTVRGSNEINTSELVYGSRFIVVAVVEGKSNPIANKFIK